MLLFSSADFFQNECFQKILSGTLWECQTVWDPDQDRHCLSWSGSKLFAKVLLVLHVAKKEKKDVKIYPTYVPFRFPVSQWFNFIIYLDSSFRWRGVDSDYLASSKWSVHSCIYVYSYSCLNRLSNEQKSMFKSGDSYAVWTWVWQGSHRLEKYLNIQDCLEKSLKIKLALKSTWKHSRPWKVLEFTICKRIQHCFWRPKLV